MKTNVGYKFYKEYFSGLKFKNNRIPVFDGKAMFDDIETMNLNVEEEIKILSIKVYFPETDTDKISKNTDNNTPDFYSFELYTIYPGLLIGSGYIHEIGSKEKEGKEYLVKNELKLGFYFDYTTGLPVIPGSSVKGVLRSAFNKAPVCYDKEWKEIECGSKKVKFIVGQYIKELLKVVTDDEWNDKQVNNLEHSIFESVENDKDIPLYKRNIFFDAFPVKSYNTGGKFLANDYITPHPNPLKNPNPIQFLKILPRVSFQFNFKLNDIGGLTANQKLELFKRILLDLGIGAKTNVGYGQFVESSDNSTPSPNPYEELLAKYTANWSNYTENQPYKAVISNEIRGFFIFSIGDDRFVKRIENIEKKFKKDAEKRIKNGKSGSYKTLKVGDEVFIRINNIEDKNFTVMPKWTAGGSSL